MNANPLKYEPLFSRLTWGCGTCAEFIGDKDTADELGAEMVARWNSQEPDIHTRKAWAAIERQNAEIKALRDALEKSANALLWIAQEAEQRAGVPKPIIGGARHHAQEARAALGVQP